MCGAASPRNSWWAQPTLPGRRQLLAARSFLQADQPHAGNLGERSKASQLERPLAVLAECRISLPTNSNAKAGNTFQLLTPRIDELRRREQIGNVGRNAIQRRLENPRQAEERRLDVKWRQR